MANSQSEGLTGKESVALLLPAAKFAVAVAAEEISPDSSATLTVTVPAEAVSTRKISTLTDWVVGVMLTAVAWSAEK